MAYRIEGGYPLYGTVRAQGSKNAALPILFAALLVQDEVRLRRVPNIGDVRETLALLSDMGVAIEKCGQELILSARHAVLPSPHAPQIRRMRASSYLLGAGIARFGEMRMLCPGGCDLGARPLNIHKDALCALGARWQEENELLCVVAEKRKGNRIYLPFPSVGATVNTILAALFCEGQTEIYGYAAEPHIACLLRFLKKCGAKIAIEAQKISLLGGYQLHGCDFTVDADEIESATYLIGAASCGGEVCVEEINPQSLFPVLQVLEKMRVRYAATENQITVCASARPLGGEDVVCAPFPAFPTDLHPPIAVLLSQTQYGGSITERVWQDRFSYVDELRKMGFCAVRNGNVLQISPTALHGAAMHATDLRGGAAMMIGALAASGVSTLRETEYVERGYESFFEKWCSLGARVCVE